MCFLKVNFHFQVQIMKKSIYENYNIFFYMALYQKYFPT